MVTTEQKSRKFQIVGANVGAAAALIYAFKVKSGFWKGLGYVILGSIVLSGVGYAADVLVAKKEA